MEEIIVLDKSANNGIKNKIYTIREVQVMLDRDLAELYGVSTKRLNEQVRRNIERFPNDFMFTLTEKEFKNWRSQFATSKGDKMGLRRPPYAFTEQGVAALSGVLRSKKAIEVNIQIMRAFIAMRKILIENAHLFQQINLVKQKLLEHDSKFEQVFKAIEDKSIKPSKGIFFDGQIFKAYKFISDLVRNTKKSIILIDNYIDDSVLTLFSKKKEEVRITIYTKNISKQLRLDVEKFNAEYGNLEIKKFTKSHDRFLILDDKDVYHIGASLKDLGKKWVAFSKFDKEALNLSDKLR